MKLNKHLAKFPTRKLDAPAIVKEKPLKGVQEKVVFGIPRAKAHLALGFIGSTMSDPQFGTLWMFSITFLQVKAAVFLFSSEIRNLSLTL